MPQSRNTESAQRVAIEEQLANWFRGQGVSQEGARRAVVLLDGPTLIAQPRPSKWNRRGVFGDAERCRYLWYRHAARILGWCDRKKFPDVVTEILRVHIFPTVVGNHEALGESTEGGVSADWGRGQLRRSADHLNTGQ